MSDSSIAKSDAVIDELIANGVNVIESTTLDTDNSRGISFLFSNGKKFVVLNNNLINDEKTKHLVIAHEREHFDHPSSFYALNESPYSIYRKEYLISKSVIRKLINEEKLFKLIFLKHLDIEELSDEFDVPIDVIHKAINYYTELSSWFNLKVKYKIESGD